MRLVYLALGWSLGIVLAANVALHLPLIWLGLALITAVLAWRARRVAGFAVLLFMLGGLRMATTPLTSEIAGYNGLGGMTIEGTVVGEPDVRDDKVLLRVAVETVTRAGTTTPTDGLVLVSAPPLSDAHYGDRISATGSLYEPGTSDRFSYADYLSRSGVFSIMQDSAVTVMEPVAGNDLFSGLIALKADAADAIKRALPEPQASLLIGMLLGNQHGIAPDVSNAFAQTGASQVIAISGFNMTVLSGVVIGLLKRLRIKRSYAAAISIGVISAYTVFVGANPSVVRAALMGGLLVIGTVLRRETYLPASLAFAALVLSLINPLVLWDVSFQLSFFATLGIALFAEPLSARFDALLTRWFRSGARLLSAVLTESLVVSVAALVFTLPLTMLYFGTVSPFILLVNLLIMPVQPALLLIGGAATLMAAISPVIAQVLYWADLLPLSWTIGVVRLFATLPSVTVFASANVIAAFFVVVLGAAILKAGQPRASIRMTFDGRKLALLGALCGLGITLLSVALYVSKPDGLLHVWLLDMGESDAVLIQTPRGAHFLIDGGQYPSRLLTAIGDRLPFTNRALEILFISQPDPAQYGALPDVLDRYDVGVVVEQGQPNLAEAFKALQAKLSAHPVVNMKAGYSVTTDDGVRIEALNPAGQPGLGESLDRNALVLRLSYGDVSFLLTSELSASGQTALVKAGKENLQASVLQIPEQGAPHALDAKFVEAVQPQIAIVQGDNPDPDTLSAVGDIPVYRTDQSGTLDLSSDGHSLWITPEKKS